MKPTNPAPLIEVAEWLEAGAPHKGNVDGFWLADWRDKITEDRQKNNFHGHEYVPPCGTVCCIAGAIAEFNGIKFDFVGPMRDVEELCGMFRPDTVRLFAPDTYVIYNATPEDAAKTIRHYLKTGNVDWSHVSDREETE